MKKVAIVGTHGIPARYGGFETLSENLVKNLSQNYQFLVYCSKIPKPNRKKEYLGARLIHFPYSASGWQAIIYDTISTVHALFNADIILLLGPAFSFVLLLNIFFRRRIVINYGGLNEWERKKYSRIQRSYIYVTYFIATKFASDHITDNELLKENLFNTFGASSQVIRYGGDHLPVQQGPRGELLARYPFLQHPYFVSVSRAQVDNNIHLLIESFRQSPDKKLVVVSNWNVSEYGRDIRTNCSSIPNITLLDAIYDPQELSDIRANACAYIHTHSYCGTAPSLVEAICLGLPTICFDVPTNRETTKDRAIYFRTPEELTEILKRLDQAALQGIRDRLEPLRTSEYRWVEICRQYDRILAGPILA